MSDTIPNRGKVHADAWSTERAAAERQTSARKREAYDRIVDLLRAGRGHWAARDAPELNERPGLTDDEMRAGLERLTAATQSKSGPATRRGELVELGYVRPQRNRNGGVVKRPSDLGGPMIVWELVPGDEYVAPPTTPTERQPTAAGLAAARRYSHWEIGDDSWAAALIRAYLNPEVVAAELDDMGAL